MKAILASKLYKASSRQDKILAQLSNPINVELVEQLREYLDDEYLTPEYFPDAENADAEAADTSTEETDTESDDSSGSTSSGGGGGSSGGSGNPLSDGDIGNGAEELEDSESEETSEESSEDTGSDDAVEEATDINGIEPANGSIADMLNADSRTAGVSRTKSKSNEYWIYYNDNINLNNVMSDVLDKLSEAGHSELQFSRLARTDNAIVLDIVE